MPQKLSEQQMAALTEALRNGKKIEAIGVYRQATGEGLKESKEAVEEMEIMLHEKHPDQFPVRQNRKGCSVFTGIGCLAFGLALFLTLKP